MSSLFAGLLSLLGLASPAPNFQGYVEGDYLRIGAPATGTLSELYVVEGGSAVQGAPLFRLNTTADLAQRDGAVARLAEAKAQLGLSLVTLKRQEALVRSDFASRQQYDQAISAVAADQARVHLAESDIAAAEQRLRDDAPLIPADSFVEKVYYRPGEVVTGGQPIVSLLPPGNVKVVFFVPEAALGALRMGQKMAFACDGCDDHQTGTVRYIASQAEYTPPVIYSVGSRDKLVFRVEAWPDTAPQRLHPGQPVDVAP